MPTSDHKGLKTMLIIIVIIALVAV